MIKGVQRIHIMNVMKQDAMNDKIKEIFKTCEKQCMQEDLNRSRGIEPSVEDLVVDRYRCRESVEVLKHQTQEMRLDRSTRCREAIEGTRTFAIYPPGIEKVSRLR